MSGGTDDDTAARMGTAWRNIFDRMSQTAETVDHAAAGQVCSAYDHASTLFGAYARTYAKVDNRC